MSSRVVRALGALVGAWTSAATSYLLVMLVSAARCDRAASAAGERSSQVRMLVLVPAHDEQAVIEDCVRSLLATDYDPELRDIVVIADNCRDATAALARAAGATVWERAEPVNPGKGQALAWALDRAQLAFPTTQAVAIVDADCLASPDLLLSLAARIVDGAPAVQCDYVGSNPDAGVAAALRFAGFALINSVRPRGKHRLGLSCGLMGTGMAFAAETLDEVPWDAFSVTEDREYGLRLISEGRRIAFAPDGRVETPMPVTAAQGEAQQTRWDSGNVELARRFALPLMWTGLRRRRIDAFHAGVELLVPPQTMLAAAGAGVALAGAVTRSPSCAALGVFSALGQVVYVLGGLRLVRAPASVYRALLSTPALLARRMRQYVRIALGRGSRSWVRTDRIP